MSRVFALHNLKGGVGKSTAAAHLAHHFARAGHATLRRVTYRGGSFALEAAPDAAPDATLRLVAPEPFALEPGARVSLEVRDGWIIPGG